MLQLQNRHQKIVKSLKFTYIDAHGVASAKRTLAQHAKILAQNSSSFPSLLSNPGNIRIISRAQWGADEIPLI